MKRTSVGLGLYFPHTATLHTSQSAPPLSPDDCNVCVLCLIYLFFHSVLGVGVSSLYDRFDGLLILSFTFLRDILSEQVSNTTMNQTKNKTSKQKNKSIVDPTKLVECPICLDVITPPISQCEVGHPMCKVCFESSNITFCPLCHGPMTNKRHVAFEQLLESFSNTLQISCRYSHKGCKFEVKPGEKEIHERDCKFRNFICEGKSFVGWNCAWTGTYDDLENHFKEAHKRNTFMQYKTEATLKISFNSNFKDIQLISFFNGQAFFYYKHFVDVQKKKLYWAFQYVGLKSTAEHYFYEFEVHKGPIRKLKVSEVCHNDTTKIEDIFNSEKCVVITFDTVKTFLNDEGELPFRFRILRVKK